ncbi:MAG: AI-2E family transporter [Armatimonadota bacterium]|nr:AI-2E family transporter [Armatimonadota bacterium]
MPSRSELIISTAIVVLTAAVVLAVARLVWLVGEILLLVLIAAILATGLSPLVEAVQARTWGRRRRQLSRGASIALVYLAVLAGLGAIGSLLITPMVAETQQFIERAPELYQQLTRLLASWKQRYAWLPDFSVILARLPQEAGQLTEYVGRATGVAFRVFGGVVSAVTVLILSVYMLLEGPAIKRGFLALFPHKHHRRVETVLRHIALKFGGWLRGQLFLGLIIGVAVGIGTWILGLPYPFLLGLAAGVTELIPMVGPVLGAIPAVLIALFGPWWRFVAVIILFTAIQQAENHLLVPRVMKMSVGLSPLLTIVAIMIGAKLMGILGALLAVPIAAALQVIVGEILRMFRTSG